MDRKLCKCLIRGELFTLKILKISDYRFYCISKKDIYIIFRKSEKKREVQVKQKVGKITTKPHSKIERRKYI